MKDDSLTTAIARGADRTASRLAGIVGRRVLTRSGIEAARIAFAGERIADVHAASRDDAPPSAADFLDAGNLLVLPGIVDLHGDAFERVVMPRPNVSFDYRHALYDTDRQLLANGITTEFHGVTLSWEGGLRGAAYAERMFDALARHRDVLGAHHYVHLRFEAHNVADVALACEWIRAGRVQFVALNDHLPEMVKRLGNARKLQHYADRAQCDVDAFCERVRAAQAAADAVPASAARLVRAALDAGLRVASHDDPNPEVRRRHHAMGCSIGEFPLTVETAMTARELGDAVVFGAPNVVRGGSHMNAPSASEMVKAGLCDVLASDYYYPAPIAAAFELAARGALPLAHAWRLISSNPARAAGLDDRGELDRHLRADAILVDDSVPGLPRVCATIVGGRVAYSTGQWAMRPARDAVQLDAA
ncbi:phosphonate metabolism protein PhnM [Burkholderia savannae]|uniref:alpha-D-ribose 1-methylphosphonate 5-triphosphate diphosphatase n=1 Tax=Burkholderia savannae TaxID=1637837 RepID=UPI0007549924|nr:alpha-D-ribose 1-methylphosphonate 5-triphosphate diphosphatase [Burkholderia savannae]AOJ85155.1 phosphonate metabolism protein PhnM [Burkholderia savannae]